MPTKDQDRINRHFVLIRNLIVVARSKDISTRPQYYAKALRYIQRILTILEANADDDRSQNDFAYSSLLGLTNNMKRSLTRRLRRCDSTS